MGAMEPKQPDAAAQPTACAKCQGVGQMAQPKPGTLGWEDMELAPCPKCFGKGFCVAIMKTVAPLVQ